MQPSIFPLQKRRFVLRQRLVEILDGWTSYRAIRIIAPGGFGKSTLCQQWLQRLSSLPDDERPLTAMLPLDTTHGALDVFLPRLAASFGDVLPQIHELAALAGAGEMTAQRAATVLANIFTTAKRPVVLVLDDLHLVPSGPVLDLLQSLLDDDINDLHFALVTRTHPSLDISELVVHGKVLSLTIDDLVFDASEFASFAEMHQLSTLPGNHLVEIERRSGGWAAGLQLLVQALPASRTLTIDALHAAEADPDIWKYVERAFFNRVSKHVAFMMETALLPWLSAELCAAVAALPAAECARMLDEIAAANSLVTPRRDKGETRYFVHPVLRELLQRRLATTHSTASLDSLRRDSAAALAGEGEIDAALELLGLPTGGDAAARPSRQIDLNLAGDLIERACRPALLRSEVAAVGRWLSYLDDAMIRARPQLAMDAAWSAYHHLDSHVHACMVRARASLQAHPHPPELDAELATLETLAALYSGRNNLAHVKLQRALSLPRSPDGVVAAYLPAIRGYLMFGEPRTREQRNADTEQAYVAFTRLGHLRGRIETLVAAQWVHTMYADSASTRIAADRVLQLLVESGMEGSTFGLYSHLYAAQILYFTDQIAEAKQRLRRVIELTGDDVSSNVLPYHALVRLQLCTLAESEDAALDIDPVADAVQYRRAIAASSPIIIAHTAVFRLLRDIRLRRFERCMDSVAIFDRTAETLTGDDSPMVQLTVLLAAVVTGRCDDFLLSRITDLHRYAYDLQHYSNSMMTHVMLVLVLQQQGRQAEATASLRTLLTEVERTGHVRYLLDFSPLLRDTLRTVGTPFAERMYRRTYGFASGTAFGLSETEYRVLKSLASRQNSVEMAAAMYISVNTVRTHIRNLYRKLQVHSRDEALDVARETGLL